MNLSLKLQNLIQEKKTCLFMPYLTLGDPDFESSVEFAKALILGGAHILELGIPFSDPTADGPIIQKAMVRATKNPNFSIETIFETTKKIHALREDIPLVYLTYFNPIFRYNKNKNTFLGEYFLKQSSEIGIRGLVIPDLPFDSREFIEIFEQIQKHSLSLSIIPMIAPNTKMSRAEMILSRGTGFVYYITSLGVTGFRDFITTEKYESKIQILRKYTNLPILAGFGIHKPEQASVLKKIFDGIIVGSFYHKLIEDRLPKEEFLIKEAIYKISEEIYLSTKKFVDTLILN